MRSHAFEIEGSGGLPIRGDVHLPDAAGPHPVVVAVHGFKGFRRWGWWPAMAAHFTGAGFAFVAFDLSHNGVGVGGLEFDEPDLFEANTCAREEHDLAAVLAAVRAGTLPGGEELATDRLGLLGHSRGGGLVVVHAARDDGVKATVGIAPVATIQRFAPDVLEKGRRDGFLPIVNMRTGEVLRFGADAIAEIDARKDLHDIAASHASRLAAPLLVVHGTADPAVSHDEGRRLAEAAPQGELESIEGADHVLGCRHPWAGPTPAFERYLQRAEAFFRAHL